MLDEQDSISGVDVPDGSDAPPELRRAFWSLVLVLNAAILALTIGILFVIFQGWSTVAEALLLFAVLLFGAAYIRYRRTSDHHLSRGQD